MVRMRQSEWVSQPGGTAFISEVVNKRIKLTVFVALHFITINFLGAKVLFPTLNGPHSSNIQQMTS